MIASTDAICTRTDLRLADLHAVQPPLVGAARVFGSDGSCFPTASSRAASRSASPPAPGRRRPDSHDMHVASSFACAPDPGSTSLCALRALTHAPRVTRLREGANRAGFSLPVAPPCDTHDRRPWSDSSHRQPRAVPPNPKLPRHSRPSSRAKRSGLGALLPPLPASSFASKPEFVPFG